jgi:hypothetical protein
MISLISSFCIPHIPWKKDSFEKIYPKQLGSRPLFYDTLIISLCKIIIHGKT